MKFTAVQMIGTQRSGSNLLRVMLNQLNEVSAPHPPHILERFLPLLPAYGALSIKENFTALVHDVCSLVAYNPVQWNHINLKEEEIINRCNKYSLTELTKVIYEMNAENENAHIWICKSLSNIHFTDLIEDEIKPLYIFLYRDGRDVACSFKKAIVGEKHVYHIAKQWQQEQELCIEVKERLRDERVISISYENLLTNPENELRKICNFIGAVYNVSCLKFYRSKEAQATAASGEMWENVSRKIITHNFNNYKNELSEDEIMLFEKIAGETLQKLNYSLNYPDVINEAFTDTDIILFNQINQSLKIKAKQLQKPEDAEKRMLQEALLSSIKKRIPVITDNCIKKIAV